MNLIPRIHNTLILVGSAFLLMQITPLAFPGDFHYFGDTISGMGAILINGQWNYLSASMVIVSHSLLLAGFYQYHHLFIDHYRNELDDIEGFIKAARLFANIGMFLLFLAILTPRGVPEPLGYVHRASALLAFISLPISMIVCHRMSVTRYGFHSRHSFVPFCFGVSFTGFVALIIQCHSTQCLSPFGLVPAGQKIGYNLFVVCILLQLYLLKKELEKQTQSTL